MNLLQMKKKNKEIKNLNKNYNRNKLLFNEGTKKKFRENCGLDITSKFVLLFLLKKFKIIRAM